MLQQAEALAPELIRLRREIHANPELSFQEFKTAALVADTLVEIGGYCVQTGVGRTGVVAELGPAEGRPLVAIRADMDALPILEESGQPYCSCHPGVMHACGHDAHTAILLGVAQLLKESYLRGDWKGRVRLLFQPSEEAADEDGISGATAMIRDGALEGIDVAIALHVISDRPAGIAMFQEGYSMAAVDSFDAWVLGDGAHGAYPHTGSDPLYMLAPILTGLYAIPSRRIDPLHPVVVSLGRVSGGAVSNVIPNQVHLSGTLRSHDPAVRKQLWVEVENVLKMSQLMGGDYRVNFIEGYPALYNDPETTRSLRTVALDLLGEEGVLDSQFGMGAEDFAYMAAAARGAMFFLGAAPDDGAVRHHHTSIFDIDESVMPKGAAILAETARRYVTAEIA